jgi:uncharacterized membrane-anchored protein YitT (DUF2179 family)
MALDMKVFLYNTLLLTIGSVICAFAVNAILVPSDFLSSGLTGFTLLLYYKWKVLPVGLFYLLLNIPVFLLSLKFINLRFVLYTAYGMFIYSAMLLLPSIQLQLPDKLLSAIIAGAISGLGIAIMLHSYGSAGGSEMICIIIYKLFGVSVGTCSLFINAILLIISAFIFPLEDVLYTMVFIFVAARITDKVFHGLAKRRTVMIISDKWKNILNELTNTHLFRVTLLSGKGGYHGNERPVLLSVVNSHNVPALKTSVIKQDPGAFIAIMEASDVTGEVVGNQPHW